MNSFIQDGIFQFTMSHWEYFCISSNTPPLSWSRDVEQNIGSILPSLHKENILVDKLFMWYFTTCLLCVGSGEGGADLFSLVSSDRMRRNGAKLHQGGLDWTLGNISSLRGWSNTGTGFLERWSMSHAYQCLRGIWTMPLML